MPARRIVPAVRRVPFLFSHSGMVWQLAGGDCHSAKARYSCGFLYTCSEFRIVECRVILRSEKKVPSFFSLSSRYMATSVQMREVLFCLEYNIMTISNVSSGSSTAAPVTGTASGQVTGTVKSTTVTATVTSGTVTETASGRVSGTAQNSSVTGSLANGKVTGTASGSVSGTAQSSAISGNARGIVSGKTNSSSVTGNARGRVQGTADSSDVTGNATGVISGRINASNITGRYQSDVTPGTMKADAVSLTARYEGAAETAPKHAYVRYFIRAVL